MKQAGVEEKLKILSFWKKYGLEATMEAYGVKRRTLFLWKQKLAAGGGQVIALKNVSRRPHQVRKRHYPQILIDEIKRLRRAHNNLGKEKLHCLLGTFCEMHALKLPSAKTLGRIIADAPDRMRITPQKVTAAGKIVKPSRKKRDYKPKGFKAKYPGHCVAFDSIERFVDGCRRYIITCIDLHSRFAFALCVSNHSAAQAEQFFQLLKMVFPLPLENILTDCGSEFQKEFTQTVKEQHKQHWHTYPKTPKMNAHDERFNRTIQEEFVDYHQDDLLENMRSFNDKLLDYLLWYNSLRPHWGLNLLSPIQFLNKHYQQCNMYWPNT